MAMSGVGTYPDDLPDVLWWHVLLGRLHIAKLPLISISLGVQLLPLSCLRARQSRRDIEHRGTNNNDVR